MATRAGAALTTGAAVLLAEFVHNGNVVSFYEGLDPEGPTFLVTETGQNGDPSVVPVDVERQGPAAVWNYLKPGQPLPPDVAPAIARAASRSRDPAAELAREQEIRSDYDLAFPGVTGDGRKGGEDYLARTPQDVAWFEGFVAQSGMWVGTNGPNHFGGLLTQWNGSAWWEHGMWQSMDVLTAFGPELEGASGFISVKWVKKVPGGLSWEVLLNRNVLPNHWFRVWGHATRKLMWRADSSNPTGDLLGLAIFGHNQEFYSAPPPPPPPPCAYSAQIETGECFDIAGQRDDWASENHFSRTGCGSTEQVAVGNAIYSVGQFRCISTSPQPGCCLFDIDIYPGVCLCP